MIDNLKPLDIGMIAGAAIMALGAFCPIVSVPLLGSLTYVHGGRGDGIFIVLAGMGIVALVIFEYQRSAGLVAAAAFAFLLRAIVGVSSILTNAASTMPASLKDNVFGAMAQSMINSVSLQWGWVLMFGGALAVVLCAIVAHLQQSPSLVSTNAGPANSEADFAASADQRIAEYIENRKISPAARSGSQNVEFGRRSRG